MIRCVEIALIIPDNEARTALATLQRLGVPASDLERADLYRYDVADGAAGALLETLRSLETVYNPNKHVLRVRDGAGPGPGEVWIDEIASVPAKAALPIRVAGRELPGVRTFERFTAWRLFAGAGRLAERDLVSAATETLLCNPAFQKATHA